jgi:2'-hydroxyisoflavone reductase
VRLLVLGGTAFVGRAIVSEALARGAEVTLFGRGKTGPELFPEASRRLGDRESGDYGSLRQGEWDAVVDASGYLVRHVEEATSVLGDRVGRYLFVSSHAVYDPAIATPGSDESAPLRSPVRDVRFEELDNETYGRAKVACENAAIERYGERATIVRPGRVVGPHDNQGPFVYWVRRAARGGRVAVPGSVDQPVQVLDARDLAHLVLSLLASASGGAFNAVGPAEPLTLGGLIETCAKAAGSSVTLVEVPLAAAPPRFPLVWPREAWPTQQRSSAKARAAGLPTTPLETTARDVRAWDQTRGEPPLERELTPEAEAQLLSHT